MEPIELVARREALGLSQHALAECFGVAQASLSGWESGRKMMPVDLEDELIDLEDRLEHLVDAAGVAIDAYLNTGVEDPPVLIVYRTNAELWEAHPELDGLPAAVHRVAMACAARECEGTRLIEEPT